VRRRLKAQPAAARKAVKSKLTTATANQPVKLRFKLTAKAKKATKTALAAGAHLKAKIFPQIERPRTCGASP
jgi:hypothetical protein